MAKSSKGNLGISIFVGIVVLVQVIILILGFLFMKDVESAKETQEELEAAASAEWTVDYEGFKTTETIHYRGYILNAAQTIRSYWHSEDRDFRLTIQSEALKPLMAQKHLVVKEGKSGDHLSLTLYYNPLRESNPSPENLIAIYQVIRYQKPEIAKLYDQKKLELEAGKPTEKPEDAEDTTEDSEEEVELSETEQALQDVKKLEDLKYYYPFDPEAILAETEDYIVYQNLQVKWDETVLNHEFLSPYFEDNSLIGDYGWEKGIFYEEEAQEDVIEEEAGEDVSEEETDASDAE